MSTRPDRLIVGSDDPLAPLPGGWLTMMQGFLRDCREPERYALAAPADELPQGWSVREFEGRTFSFFRLPAIPRLPLSRRIRTALSVYRRYSELSSFGTVYSHGPEILLPFVLRRHPGSLVVHVLGDIEAEVRFGRLAVFRGPLFAHGYARLVYAVMRRCDEVVWVDPRQLPRAPADIVEKSVVLGTFFDDAVYCPLPVGRAREPILLTVGRLEPIKRLDLVVRALALAASRGKSWRLVVCGSGSDESRLHALAHDLGVHDRIEWHPEFLQAPAVADLMRRADVGLLVSDREGSPTVVKEMLGTGLPIVASDVGDVATVIAGAANAELLARVDSETIAAAVDRLLEGRDTLRRMPEHMSAYSLRNWVREFEQIFERAGASVESHGG